MQQKSERLNEKTLSPFGPYAAMGLCGVDRALTGLGRPVVRERGRPGISLPGTPSTHGRPLSARSRNMPGPCPSL